jgi:glycogen phosphorylase
VRLLTDVHGLDFDVAWDIARRTFSYTNHTLLPEALESWPVPLFERLLPRHMQIVYAINAKILVEARKDRGFEDQRIRNISLIEESGERRVRMGNLAFIGSHSINGVSALHTELMKETVFADLHKLYPDRINNKTNGITPRRWLMQCNPGLFELIRESIGDAFMDDAEQLKALDAFADNKDFQERFAAIKRENKNRLANLIGSRMGVRIDPTAMFDIQIKRIHEYKRQLLNIIEAVALYDQIRSHPELDWVPRVKLFAGKAAPSYHNAKLIIKLANDVAKVINNDPAVRGLLKVVFVPNYNVSLAEIMVPAADLSEQISTAGMEASGTGNMKFALNGALTIGTLDGANVEMRDCVGEENIVIFGMTAEEVAKVRSEGHNPRAIIEQSRELSQALAAISSGVFSPASTITTGSWWRPISTPMPKPSATWTRSGPTRPRGIPRPSGTPPAWDGSPPTARSANTPRKSGGPDDRTAEQRHDGTTVRAPGEGGHRRDPGKPALGPVRRARRPCGRRRIYRPLLPARRGRGDGRDAGR